MGNQERLEGLYLAPIFSDGMILQREKENEIYGIEAKENVVEITFMEQTVKVDVMNQKFSYKLPPSKAGGPYTIGVKGSSEIIIQDIYFGDVYLLSGQSNMELPIRRVLDVSYEEIKESKEPFIRQYLIPASYNFKEPNPFMAESKWVTATSPHIYDFSALGYFFAKEIKECYDIPIGLIMTAVGGSSIEAWMSPTTLRNFGDYEKVIQDFYDIEYFNTYIGNQQKAAMDWVRELEEKEEIQFFDYKEWDSCHLPALIGEFGLSDFSGSIYFVKEVYLEKEQVQDTAYLYMGTIIDSDQIYVNDVLIGRTEYRYPPRKYSIPLGVLKTGFNKIVVRIVVNNKNGGMIPGRPYYLFYEDERISLEGEWLYKTAYRAMTSMPPVLFPPSLPVSYYHTVLVPLSRVSIKAMLWYQGESNTYSPNDYAKKFEAFAHDVRVLYQYELAILYVQLSNYREPLNNKEDTGWAMLREQQRQCLSINKTGMVVTFDIGESNELHPQNKKVIGVRMAKLARHVIYGEDISYSGPLPKKMINNNNHIVIEFKYLEPSEDKMYLSGFEVAGEEGIFYPAIAYRLGERVVITCESVTEPKAVRYAWCDSPVIDFYNDAGLPASGFCIGY